MLIDSEEGLKEFKQGKFWTKLFLYSIGITIPLTFVFGLGGAIFSSPLLAWPLALWRSHHHNRLAYGIALRMQDMMLVKALGNPQASAYFCIDYAWMPCAVAADPKANTVTVVCWSGATTASRLKELPEGCLISHTFKINELTHWEAVKPGAQLVEAVGSLTNVSTSDMLAMNRKNAAALLEQRENTGLTLQTSKLEQQEVFLNLNYESAKQWILLLTKLSNGELPTLTEATEFPKIENHQ